MNAKYKNFKYSCQDTFCLSITESLPFMDEQDIGNIAWGFFGQMECSYIYSSEALKNAFVNAVVKNRSYLTIPSLVAIFQGTIEN